MDGVSIPAPPVHSFHLWWRCHFRASSENSEILQGLVVCSCKTEPHGIERTMKHQISLFHNSAFPPNMPNLFSTFYCYMKQIKLISNVLKKKKLFNSFLISCQLIFISFSLILLFINRKIFWKRFSHSFYITLYYNK